MSTKQADNAVILTIRNHHYDPCPADFAPESAAFLSYFEGLCGDQWVLRWDGESDHVTLAGGDVAWKTVQIPIGALTCEALILGRDEATWVYACMQVVNTRAEFRQRNAA